jgi:2-oxoglutarate dehydrogenase E2 component (dihydrolipoamide succinyltransferase)
MSIELKVPAIGESITEVIVGDWFKAEGDFIRLDEDLVVVESDKVNLEVPSPCDGRVVKVLKQTGETAQVGETIAQIEECEVPEEAPAEVAPTPVVAEAAPVAVDAVADPIPVSAPEVSAQPSVTSSTVSGPAVMPAAARILAVNGLTAAGIVGSGRNGRILKEDALRHVAAMGTRSKPAPTPQAAPRSASVSAHAPIRTQAASTGERSERRVRMTPLRKTVARRLVEAQQNAALLTTFNEVDMSEVMKLRKIHQPDFVDKHGVKLGFMSFFVKAVVDGLREFPAINAVIDGGEIVYREYYDIGIAVGGGKGLVVPVIRNADQLGFAEIEHTIRDFGARAQQNKIKLDELMGGTFSVTNGGVYGSLLSTPIVNPPQSGILGMHGIQERPMAVDGEVVIRPMMYIALTYDHRIVDGREAVGFLVRLKNCIENPIRLALEV